MDIIVCTTSSLLGRLVWARMGEFFAPGPSFPTLEPTGVFLFLFLIQYVIVKTYRLFIYPYFLSPLRSLPGPKDHHFLLGQTLRQFTSGSPTEPYTSWVRKWPGADMIRYFSFLNSDAVLVVSPEAHRQILQANCYAFTKPAWYYRLIFPIVGRGLVFMDGDEHKLHRKVLSGAFALTHLKKLIPLMEEKATEVCMQFDTSIDYTQGIINLIPPLSRITLDVIATTVLGVPLATLDAATPFHQIYQTVFDPSTWGLVLSAVNAVVPIRWLSVGENRRFNRAIAQLHALLREIIRLRVADEASEKGRSQAGDGGERKDILTRMVQESKAMGLEWGEEDMIGHVLTFMAAGHETTSNTIAWAVHYLALYPDIQDRLREEALEAAGGAQNMEYAAIENMKLLDNIYREVLRVRSAATFATREAARDIEICGTVIPKGTSLMLMPCATHLNPLIWGPRAAEFDPDRWDSLQGEAAKPHAFAAFLMGPRGCPGQVYTRLEFKVMMIAFVRKFRFYAVEREGEVPLVNPSVVLRPKGGLRVFAQRINQA
ncbi:related to benzoate 4-monooxygenase cytochrome P450 [Cephalotrichum gorgonifer]|uniref:Related to benzoate 4-monooxygenase cytochrome P450 n=1 Tax=Cephalotrichum gorgonifer TaxID=2041049 RepID=A0AAE8MY60_9PEZI|nr:related to benzoate 4-monooxygenase cytochrome P450 [Cephalotrichum gorgonifer]